MGDGGAGDRALGRVAVRLLLLAGLALLSGCAGASSAAVSSAGPVSGALVGIGLGSVTANPFIAYAAGVSTQAAVTALQKHLSRKLQQGEQDNITAQVARLQPGQTAAWKIHYAVPFVGPDEHGDVTVTQVETTPLVVCKDVAFTVIAGKQADAKRAIYLTSACAETDGAWKWAEAEPAVSRWGFLQ
jgi:hypothetical protein